MMSYKDYDDDTLMSAQRRKLFQSTIYNKIKKIYNILEHDVDSREDFKIVSCIKKEYIETKKISKSMMLYLNKIYRETKNEEGDIEDGDVEGKGITSGSAIW